MANATTPQVVRSYLAQLEKALTGLPAEVRDEIVAGVREELDGLDAAAAATRIEALGDPTFIASEARAEANLAAPTSATPPMGSLGREPRWFAVLAALLVAFGGVVIPVIGWVVGLALMWMSSAWSRREKTLATLLPIVVGFLVTAVSTVVTMWSGGVHGSGLAGFNNPLVPTFFDSVWSVLLLFVLINAVVGIWLLWRAKTAWASPISHSSTTSAAAPQASWYPVVAVLLIIGGGYLVPVVGWVVGVTMLWGADVWSLRQKWLGTLAGPIAAAAFLLIGLTVALATGESVFSGLFGWNLLMASTVPTLVANLLGGIHLLRNRVG